MTTFERWSVWTTTAVATVSGLGFAAIKYLITPDDPFTVINHPLEPWFLKAHVLSAPLMLFAIGMIMLKHVWVHIRNRTKAGKRVGWILFVGLAPMVFSGYAIQVLAIPAWIAVLGVVHLILGAAFAMALAGHRPRRKKRGSPRNSPHLGVRRVSRDVLISGRHRQPQTGHAIDVE